MLLFFFLSLSYHGFGFGWRLYLWLLGFYFYLLNKPTMSIFYHLLLLFVIFKLNILRFRDSTIYLCYCPVRFSFNSIFMVLYWNFYACLFHVYSLLVLFMALEVNSNRISQGFWFYWLGIILIITSFILFLELSCDLFAGYVMLLLDNYRWIFI